MEQSLWLHPREHFLEHRQARRPVLRPPPITLLDVELAFVEVDAGYDGDEEDSSDRWAGSYTHMHPQRMVGLVETVTGVHQTNTSVG